MKDDLLPHQKKALAELNDGKILCGPTGSGKSRVAVQYYLDTHPHQDIYVITTAKKRDHLDWEGEFSAYAIGKHADATVGGILTVDSWNNIAKYVEVEGALFILDEQRLVGKGAWVKSFLKISEMNDWIMLSGTPGDTWMDYIPVFIANGYYRNRTEFIREHVVYSRYGRYPKVERYTGTRKLERLRREILVNMPYASHTTRHSSTYYVEHNEELLQYVIKKRWHIYYDRAIRDIAELFGVMRRVVNSDPSRVKGVRSLLEKHNKLIVFYNFDYELELLRALGREIEVSEWNGYKRDKFPQGSEGLHLVQYHAGSAKEKTVAVAEWNGHKHQDIPVFDDWAYLVQYAAGAEAWECTETNAINFYSLTYSYKLWEQAHGRIDRMNTPFFDLYYYIMRSRSKIDGAIWQALKHKKSFNAGNYDLEKLKIE